MNWATWKFLVLTLIWALFAPSSFAAAPLRDPDYDAVDGPNVRVQRHEDGTRTHFLRSPDGRKLTKKRYAAGGAGIVTMIVVYTMDASGNPLGCKIMDGRNELLFKASYGYRKSDGQLVEERLFDARVIRRDPNTGKEMPVRRICYVYDADGKRSAPIVYNLLPGKTFEQVFGIKSSALESNPFQDGKGKGKEKRFSSEQ